MRTAVCWIVLVLGGFCEAGWAYCLNMIDAGNGRKALWMAAFLFLYLLSAVCLAFGTKEIPVGTAYAVWTGIGALGTTLMGVLLFDESASPVRLALLFLIFAGVVGLKFVH